MSSDEARNLKLRALYSFHVDGAWDDFDVRQRRWSRFVDQQVENFCSASGRKDSELDVMCIQGAWGMNAGVGSSCLSAAGSGACTSRCMPRCAMPCSRSGTRANCCMFPAFLCAIMCGGLCGGCCCTCRHSQRAYLRDVSRLPHVTSPPSNADLPRRSRVACCSSSGLSDSGLCVLSSAPPEEVTFVKFEPVMARGEDVVRKGALVCRWGNVVVINAHLSRDAEAREAQMARVRDMVPKLCRKHEGAEVHICISAKLSREDATMQTSLDRLKMDSDMRPAMSSSETTADGRECDYIITSSHGRQTDSTIVRTDLSRHALLCASFNAE